MVKERASISPQRFLNGEIHDWYRFVWGFSDHLVSGLLDEFQVEPGCEILDPFCGTGTTLVECLKRGISATGVDANPASLFAARVKTRWSLRSDSLLQGLEVVLRNERSLPRNLGAYKDDLTYAYLESSGMLARNWIGGAPLRRVLALKHAIVVAPVSVPCREALMLALLNTVVQDASNVRFGPELFVGHARNDAHLVDHFASRVVNMALDLSIVEGTRRRANLVLGDARRIGRILSPKQFDAVICSPPYPTEHDYTRNARLELAFLETVTGRKDLRAIKRRMIRSNSKGVYASDRDYLHAWGHPQVARIARKIDRAVGRESHGFGKLYSEVVASYFGGMFMHFRSVKRLVRRGGFLAYVVSDQASYVNVRVPTAEILADLAEWSGLKVTEIRHWRSRQSSATSRVIDEEILLLKRSD
jgi:SAM-dependent methyltransferase